MNTHRPLLSPLRRFLEIIPEAWPISPAQCEREKVKAYARAHASPFCGCECPPKAICRNEPACDEQRKNLGSKEGRQAANADEIRKHGHMPDITLPPAVQARVEMGRWHGAHSRHPFGAN